MEKELASLAPWAWDPLVNRHAPGSAMMRDFTEVVADKTVTKGNADAYRFNLENTTPAPTTAARSTAPVNDNNNNKPRLPSSPALVSTPDPARGAAGKFARASAAKRVSAAAAAAAAAAVTPATDGVREKTRSGKDSASPKPRPGATARDAHPGVSRLGTPADGTLPAPRTASRTPPPGAKRRGATPPTAAGASRAHRELGGKKKRRCLGEAAEGGGAEMHEVLPRDSARRDAAPSDDTPRHPETLAGKNLVGELERVVDEEAKARRRKKPSAEAGGSVVRPGAKPAARRRRPAGEAADLRANAARAPRSTPAPGKENARPNVPAPAPAPAPEDPEAEAEDPDARGAVFVSAADSDSDEAFFDASPPRPRRCAAAEAALLAVAAAESAAAHVFPASGTFPPAETETPGRRLLAAFYAAAKRGGLGAAHRPELEDEPNRISSKNGQEQTVPNSGTPGSAAPVCVVVGPFRGSDVRDAVRASAHPAAAGAWSPRARATPRRVVPFTAELARACVFLADVDRGFDEENTKRGGGGGGGGGRMGAANGGV